jgi:23S rRNA (cytidine1920-2'-O)/16S rRNA (cytidine1409-2'-O)-methyltransferase
VKLDHALRHFGLSPKGLLCLDIGASTGGFTDVLLHHGAAQVVAVDVGHGQLAWRLRNDPRVTVLERVNARYLEAAQLPEGMPGALVCDASFIGLQTVLPAPLALCAPEAWAVALIKPQFEVGKAVAKGGVVRDPAVHRAVCDRIAAWWAGLPGWRVLGVEPSPLLGPEGNREFLIAARRQG